MWRWYRNQLIDGAPLMTVVTLVAGVLAIWRALDGDGRSAAILAAMTLVFGVWTMIGWQLRRRADGDPCAPR
jgi:hypothetical protein